MTASADRTIRLWHSPDHPELRLLRGHIGGINAVAYSPHGDRLVSAGGVDKTAKDLGCRHRAGDQPACGPHGGAHRGEL